MYHFIFVNSTLEVVLLLRLSDCLFTALCTTKRKKCEHFVSMFGKKCSIVPMLGDESESKHKK